MARILGIDHGDARIGLAISDDLEMLAHPLETLQVRRGAVLERLAELVVHYGVRTVVLGMPYRMDGSEGTAVDKVRAFRAEVANRLGGDVTIVEVDERLTTVAAQEKLHAAGRTVKQSRGRIDQMAAVEILQDYLNAQAPPLALDPEDDPDWLDHE